MKDLGAASAYAYAVEQGYTGTEEEYAQLMASYASVAEDAEAAAERAETAAQTLVVDDTLTQTGQPADAKVVGDEITDLKSALNGISAFEVGDNKLNLDDPYYLSGKFLASTTGAISDNTLYNTTGFILVPSGYKAVVYATDGNNDRSYSYRIRSYCAYNEIGGTYRSDLAPASGSSSYHEIYNSTQDDLYYRFSIYANQSDWVLIVVPYAYNNGASPYMTIYAPYTVTYHIKDNALQCLESESITNILSGTTWVDGYISAANGTLATNSNYTTTDHIEIESDKYIISSLNDERREIFTIAFYDSNKQVIYIGTNGGDGTQGTTGYVYVPTGAKYCRITYAKSNYSASIVVFQSYTVGYSTSRYTVKDAYNTNAIGELIGFDFQKSPLYGKKVSWFGDSIIHNQWWVRCSVAFNMTSTDNGIGGTKISGTGADSMCQASRIDGTYASGGIAVPDDAEIIIIGAGTNDWAQSVSLGAKQIQYDANWDIVEDATTFYQACHKMFRNFATLRPNARIIVLGTPFGFYPNRSAFTNKYGILNNQGLSSLDYGDALCDVAEMWGHIALRYGKGMGINDTNASTLLDPSESSGHLHPTTRRAKERFFNSAMNGLMSIKHLFAY